MKRKNYLDIDFSKDQHLALALKYLQDANYEKAEDHLASAMELQIFRVKRPGTGELMAKVTLPKVMTDEEVDSAYAQIKEHIDLQVAHLAESQKAKP